MFLILFLHFWYHAYTKGQRLPKMAKNGISKDQWNKFLSLKTKKCICQSGNLHYLTIKIFRCTCYTVYIFNVFFQNRICIFTVSYLGFGIWGVGVAVWISDLKEKKKKRKKGVFSTACLCLSYRKWMDRGYLSRRCTKIKIFIGKIKMRMTSTEYFECWKGIKLLHLKCCKLWRLSAAF